METESEAIGAFLSAVASGSVSPASGTAVGVVGATGAALCEMCCTHTLGEREDGALATYREDLERLRGRLLTLADADEAAVDALFGADDSGPAEQKRAVGVPLAIAEACADVVEAGAAVTVDGIPSAVPDAATGVLLAHAALRGAAVAVRHNVGEEDGEFAAETRGRVEDAERRADAALEAARERVDGW